MSDDRISGYLRSRSLVDPPPEFVGAVLAAIADAPQQRASRFAPLLPVALGVSAVAAAIVVALMLGQAALIGPSPSPSGAAVESASPSASVGPEDAVPTPEAATYVARGDAPFSVIESDEADALFEESETCTNPEGYTVRFPDSWYTNTAIGAVPPCSWFSPTFFEADASNPDRVPDAVAIDLGFFVGGVGQIPEQPRTLEETVELSGIEGYRTEDVVPADPPGFHYSYGAWMDEDSLGRKFGARTSTPGHGGDYVLNRAVLDRMMASLDLSTTAAPPDAPFSPDPHAGADALFAETATCENPVDGYRVEYPASWFTNVAAGATPACIWFAPTPVQDDVQAIWISIFTVDSAIGYTSVTDMISNEEVRIGGRVARRVEFNDIPLEDPANRRFNFVTQIGASELTGPMFVAVTDSTMAGDYELAKAVLDRIMASIEFTD